MTIQHTVRRDPNPTPAHLLPGIAILGLAIGLAALGLVLQLTIGASTLPATSHREALRGVQAAYTAATYLGAAAIIALALGMLSYALDLMGRWSRDDAPAAIHEPPAIHERLAEREVNDKR